MKGRPEKTTEAARWLKAFLSGGYRMANDIAAAGKQQQYCLSVVKHAKKQLGFRSVRVGTLWAWRDPSVIERSAPDAKAELEDKLMYKLDMIERLAQIPKSSTSAAAVAPGDEYRLDGPIKDIPLDATDEHGFLKTNPVMLGLLKTSPTVTVMQIHRRLRELVDRPSGDLKQQANEIFAWAYPHCGLPESIVAMLIRDSLLVDIKRSDIRSLSF